MKIYVASSWRNDEQPVVVGLLRDAGHIVYDFHNPGSGDYGTPNVPGFHWSDIDPEWQNWSPEEFVEALSHPVATQGCGVDFAAMNMSDAVVIVMPCGRSAHLEFGWGIGAGKQCAVLLNGISEPELMYGLAHKVCCSVGELIEWAARGEAGK